MPDFTIETTYHLPVFRRRAYVADTLDAACRAAVDDDNWDIAEKDYKSSGAVHVTGVWDGSHAVYSDSPIQIPSQFDEPVQRRARHFEILLGLLKIPFDDVHAARPPSLDWLARSAWEIARGETILAGNSDPDEPVDPPKPTHVLARLQEDRIRAIIAVIEVDPDFSRFPAEQVTDDDIHAACLDTVAALSLSDEIGNAEFRAAMTALQAARRRSQSE